MSDTFLDQLLYMVILVAKILAVVVPLILVAAGTGIAPYRAFFQQLEAEGASPRSWLIFGNPRMQSDFLYQAEWLGWRAGGLLDREGIAKISQFSRSCNSDGIPIIWLQDISGFDIGLEAEKHGRCPAARGSGCRRRCSSG